LFEALNDQTPVTANTAWITFGSGGPSFAERSPGNIAVYDLSPTGNFAEAAQHLFRILRLMAERKYDYVAVQLLPEEGLGRAINDRLRRAAATE